MSIELKRLHAIFQKESRALTFRNLRNRLKSESALVHALLRQYGKHYPLYSEGTGNQALYAIREDHILAASPLPLKHPQFVLPDLLWRGWINPVTGIVPARLGT